MTTLKKSSANRGDANRFSRLVSDAQRVQHDRLRRERDCGRRCAGLVRSGPVLAGWAEMSFTPCQLTGTPPSAFGVKLPLAPPSGVEQEGTRGCPPSARSPTDSSAAIKQHPAIQVAVAQEVDDLGIFAGDRDRLHVPRCKSPPIRRRRPPTSAP